MNKKTIKNIVYAYRNDRSVELFNRPENQLSIDESLILDKYIKDFENPKWLPITINGENTEYLINNIGFIKNSKTGRILKLFRNRKGYYTAKIYINKKDINVIVHRLVAETFIPNPENKPQVNHISGVKCNWVGNLEWVTGSENMKHAVENNLKYHGIGEKSNHSIYNNNQINEVCRLLSKKSLRNTEISKLTGVDVSTVSLIKQGKTWKHISVNYDITPAEKNAKGSNAAASKYSDKQIKLVCKMLEDNFNTLSNISKITNVGIDMIWRIKNRKNWTHISNNYKF